MYRALLDLVFPPACLVCHRALYRHEEELCTSCLHHLPKVSQAPVPDERIARKWWGKIQVKQTLVYLKFSKEGPVQKVLHHIKYHGGSQTAHRLALEYASSLALTDRSFEIIVPVPLHKTKLNKRGYNQSHQVALGLAKVWQVPVYPNALVRTSDGASQTRKSRWERWRNVETAYMVGSDAAALADKHVLLVDDVITSGATTEACLSALLKAGAREVSVAALAVAY